MNHPVHLILSPGTRIVTRNDANRVGGGEFIAAGAVAVITDSPADAQHAYKVRFNDCAKAMLRRNEFSILKEFKGVPDRGCVTDQPQHAGSNRMLRLMLRTQPRSTTPISISGNHSSSTVALLARRRSD